MDMADREPEQRHISPEELQRAQAAIRMLSAIPMGPSFSDAASDSRSRSGVSAGDSRSRSDAAAGDFTCRSVLVVVLLQVILHQGAMLLLLMVALH